MTRDRNNGRGFLLSAREGTGHWSSAIFGPSAVVLIAVNAVPLIGVLAFGWRVFDVLLLYWAENVLVGLLNVLRMLIVRPDSRISAKHKPQFRAASRQRLFFIPFFAVHYGLFCYGHLMALSGIFDRDVGLESLASALAETSGTAANFPLWIAVAAIAISHLFSLFTNFIGAAEYRRTNLGQLMRRPYGRVVILHVTILVGGALIALVGAPVSMLVVLVVAKTAFDLKLHAAERARFGASGQNRPT